MAAFLLLLAPSLLASLALAKPIPGASNTVKGFSVSQSVAKPYRPGAVRLAQAYNKFSRPVPTDIATAASSANGGEATATPEEYDEAYLVSVSVGGQDLNLDFDTGSADLWVFSSELPASERVGHSYYDPTKSSNSKLLPGETWNISYGDGSSASGNVFGDNVDVGGITVTSQAVEAAETISSEFEQDTDIDGLVGLAFSSINTVSPDQQNTFFQTSINEGLLGQHLFTADLKKGQPGTYDFGYIDSSKYTGDITYTAVDNSQGFWGFTADGYAFGDGTFVGRSYTGIADTGTTLLLLDDLIVDTYYLNISGASYSLTDGGWVFPSSADLPDFVVGINGAKLTIPGSYLKYAPTDDSGETTYGGLQSSDGIGVNIFGDIFLKAVFVVFDNDNLQLGFASKDL
ncbi:hypothetical protein DV736_g4573, partial [Chaetothyriales sp. CBS 134916]